MMLNHLRPLLFLLFTCCLYQIGQGQTGFDEQAFRSMSPAERYQFVKDIGFWDMDSTFMLTALPAMISFAEAQGEHPALMRLLYYSFSARETTCGGEEGRIFRLLERMKAVAAKHGTEAEKIVVDYWWVFSQHTYQKPAEQF